MIHGQVLSDGRLYVDNTLLAMEAKCQLNAHVRMAFGQEAVDESATLVSGQAIHKAMEVLFKGGEPKDALWALEQFYKPKWDAWAADGQMALTLGMKQEQFEKDRRSYENVRKVVGTWLVNNPRSGWPFEANPASVEQTFSVLLDPEEDIWYTGTPDVGEAILPGGARYAIDHKSTGRMTREWQNGFRTSGQVSGYLWGLQEVTGLEYTGMFINGIELSKVPGSTRKCTEHGVPYAECGELHLQHNLWPVTRLPEQLVQWKATAIRLARRYKARLLADPPIKEIMTEGELTKACGYCQCFEWCATGRQVSELNVRFMTKFWDPMTRFVGEGSDGTE